MRECRGLKPPGKKGSRHSVPSDDDDDDDLIETQPRPRSFFKTMFVNRTRNHPYMTIPSAYAPHLYHLVDHNVQLKDCLGTLMEVKVSCVADGSLAFAQGWRDFVAAHNIVCCDILVFRRIHESVFEVEIFDNRSGCARLQFDVAGSLHPPEQSDSEAADDHGVAHPAKGNRSCTQRKESRAAPPANATTKLPPAEPSNPGAAEHRIFRSPERDGNCRRKEPCPVAPANAAPEEDDAPCIKLEVPDRVKLESAGSEDDDCPFSKSLSFSFTVPPNNHINMQMQELTEPLPFWRPSGGRRRKRPAIPTLLRDSSKRMWPVLYLDNYRSTRFLTGWDSFVRANIDAGRATDCHFRRIACDFMPAFQVTCVPRDLPETVGGRSTREVSTSTRKHTVGGEDLKRVVATSNRMRRAFKQEGEPRKRKLALG